MVCNYFNTFRYRTRRNFMYRLKARFEKSKTDGCPYYIRGFYTSKRYRNSKYMGWEYGIDIRHERTGRPVRHTFESETRVTTILCELVKLIDP